MEDFSYTPERAIEEGAMKLCILCHSEISQDDIRKARASWLPAGAGLRFSVHNDCLSEIEQVINERREQERQAEEATQFVRDLARIAQQPLRKDR